MPVISCQNSPSLRRLQLSAEDAARLHPRIPAGNVTTVPATAPGMPSPCFGAQLPRAAPFRTRAVNMQGLHSLGRILKGGRVVSPALSSWWRPQSTDEEVRWGLSLSFTVNRCCSTSSLGWNTKPSHSQALWRGWELRTNVRDVSWAQLL